MAKKNDSGKPTMQISMNMPVEMNDMLDQLAAKVMINNRIKIPKTEIYLELLGLLNKAKIDPKKVKSAEDITAQLVEYIKKKK